VDLPGLVPAEAELLVAVAAFLQTSGLVLGKPGAPTAASRELGPFMEQMAGLLELALEMGRSIADAAPIGGAWLALWDRTGHKMLKMDAPSPVAAVATAVAACNLWGWC